MRLQDKVALVTGGGRGIGRAIALAYAKEGADLVVLAPRSDDIRATAEAVEALGRRALYLTADVACWDQVSGAVEDALAAFGRIDVLVNNAGVHGPIGPLAANDPTRWLEAVMVNLGGTFTCCKAVLTHMMSRRQGKIVNLSGGGAVSVRPNFSAYSSSKAAVVRLTECLAEEVRPYNIQVNAISPGGVHTYLTEEVLAAGELAGEEALLEARRIIETRASPGRAASLAVFLASDASGGLSGRLISALWDDWRTMPDRMDEIMASNRYTVRRVA